MSERYILLNQTFLKGSLFLIWHFVYICSDSDFWFPMNSSASGPVPPCARGHTATFDPDSKAVFVYGGLRESQRYSELYILNTLTWKWRLVTVGLFENHHAWTKPIQVYYLVQTFEKNNIRFYPLNILYLESWCHKKNPVILKH